MKLLLLGCLLVLLGPVKVCAQSPGYLGKTFTIEASYGPKLIANETAGTGDIGSLISGVGRIGVNYAFRRFSMVSLRAGKFTTRAFETFDSKIDVDVKTISLELNVSAAKRGYLMPLGSGFFIGVEYQSAEVAPGLDPGGFPVGNPNLDSNTNMLYALGGLMRRNLITDFLYWTGRVSARLAFPILDNQGENYHTIESLKQSNYFELEFGLGVLLF